MIGETGELLTDELFKKYIELGGGDTLGEPLGLESITKDGKGRYRPFERGSIYWTPETGACVVRGRILDRWNSLGAELSELGYPTNDEKVSSDTVYTSFQGGSIVYNHKTGRYETHSGRQLLARYRVIIVIVGIWFIVAVALHLSFKLDTAAIITGILGAFTTFMLSIIRFQLTGHSSDED